MLRCVHRGDRGYQCTNEVVAFSSYCALHRQEQQERRVHLEQERIKQRRRKSLLTAGAVIGAVALLTYIVSKWDR